MLLAVDDGDEIRHCLRGRIERSHRRRLLLALATSLRVPTTAMTARQQCRTL